jgi:hypothetical protein
MFIVACIGQEMVFAGQFVIYGKKRGRKTKRVSLQRHTKRIKKLTVPSSFIISCWRLTRGDEDGDGTGFGDGDGTDDGDGDGDGDGTGFGDGDGTGDGDGDGTGDGDGDGTGHGDGVGLGQIG